MPDEIAPSPQFSGLTTSVSPSLPIVLLAFTVAIIDLSIITRWIGGNLGPFDAIAEHLIASVFLCLLIGLSQRGVTPQLFILGLLLMLLGPLSSFAILVAGLHLSEQRPADTARGLAGWSEASHLQPSTAADALALRIRQDRRPRNTPELLQSYHQIFLHGDTVRQQRALAAISRFYAPEMLPALRLALASPYPAVRVQAAAVFAKLRGSFTSRSKELLAANLRNLTSDEAISMIASCRAVAGSGFVEEMVADQLAERIEHIKADFSHSEADAVEPFGAEMAGRLPPPRLGAVDGKLKRYSCGGLA